MPYLNHAEVESAVINLSVNYPSLTQLIVLPEKSVEGRTIHALRIGKIPGKPAVLFIACAHAREWGSADILVNFAADLLEAYSMGSGITYGGKSYSAATVKMIVETLNVLVLPDVNPDGKKYSQETDAMWRKNRNAAYGTGDCVGVDLNRNYDFLFDYRNLFSPSSGVSVSDNPCDRQLYHGPAPLSEPETRNVKYLLETYEPRWFIDVHSYSELLLYTWGDDDNQSADPTMNFQNPAFNGVRGVTSNSGQAGTPLELSYREYIDPADQTMLVALGNSMKDAIQAVRGKSYTNEQSIGLYPVSGGVDDFAYARHILNPASAKTLSFTIEWGTQFQPPFAEMENIIQDISSALMAFCKEAPCPPGLTTVALTTASIEFTDIPEGETTVRAAGFKVNSCPAVTFSVINGPAVTSGVGSFSLPLGGTVSVPAPGNYYAQQTVYLWIGFTGTANGDSATGTVTIRCNETGEQWQLIIHANTVHRPTVAVELVLDKSNSMNFISGFTLPYLDTRIKVLHYSALPLADIIQEANGIGICSFDHNAYPVMPVTVAGPLAFGPGRNTARNAILNHQPNPAGNTAIGDGVIQGMSDLSSPAAAGYDARAMIVLTDGFDTDHLAVSEVTGTLNNSRVFAIGLGSADQIKPAALDALSNSTGGYLLLTGNMNNDDQFLLSKYYLQILAGITNTDIVTDPDGTLYPGDEHVIPVLLNEADISTDIVLLSPAPGLIEFMLKTPNGVLINPSMTGSVPGLQFSMGINSAFYRISLPLPVGAAGAGPGLWQVIVRRSKRGGNEPKHLSNYNNVSGGLKYNVSIYSFSNLKMRAAVYQDSYQPGAVISVRAVFTQYGLAMEKINQVQAKVQYPDNTVANISLAKTATGIFESSFKAVMPGVYRIHLTASGSTIRGLSFTREQLLTASVYRGGNIPPTIPGDKDGKGNCCCEFINCVLKHKVISEDIIKRWEKLGFNLKALEKCCHEKK